MSYSTLTRKKSLRQSYAEKCLRDGFPASKPRKTIKSRPKDQKAVAGLTASRKPLKRTPLRRVSSAKAIANRVYSDKRKAFMLENPICEARLEGCLGQATECHHANGREGKNFLDVSTWKALCNSCHEFVHRHPNQAREIGLLR